MKKALSALLAISMAASSVPVITASADAPSVKLYLTADQTTVHPGDVITYTLAIELSGNGYFNGLFLGFDFPEELQFQAAKGKNQGFTLLGDAKEVWADDEEGLAWEWDPWSEYKIAEDEADLQKYLDGEKSCFRGFFFNGAGVTSGLQKDVADLPLEKQDIISFKVKVRDNAASGDYSVSLDDTIEEAAVLLITSDGVNAPVKPVLTDSGTAEITVEEEAKPDPESVTAPAELTIDGCKDKGVISATVNPDAADQTVTYESDNTAVATVDSKGNITPVSKGVANIISKAAKEGVQATTKVNVLFKHTLVKTDEVPATCKEAGTKAYWTCADCGKMFSDAEGTTEITETETIPVSTTHTGTLTKTEAVPATCKADGTEAYWTCSDCGKMYSDAEGTKEITAPVTISKSTVEHKAGTPVKENEVPATCEKGGSYDEVVYCTVCGAELSRETKNTEPTGEHKMTTHEKVDATCAAAGSKAYYECSECGKKFLDAEGTEIVTNEADLVIPKSTTHTGTISETPETPATCAAPGEKAHYECSECGKKYLDEEGTQEITDDAQLVIPVSETHTGELVKTEAVPATCKEDGTEAYWTCSVCGKMYSDADGKNEITAPVTISKTTVDHTPGEAVKENEVPATCGQAGSYDEVVYCTVCNEELSRETKTIDATGKHSLVHHDKIPATCGQSGTEEYWECKTCNLEFSDAEGENPISQPVEIEPTGEHDYQFVDGVPATCTENGAAEHFECSVCGKFFAVTDAGEPGDEIAAEDIVVKALDHDWGEWEIVKEATETEDGLKRRVCKRNDEHFEEEVIPATGKQDDSSEVTIVDSSDVSSEESVDSAESSESKADDSSKADTSKAADTSSKAAAAAGTTNPSTGAAAGTMAAGIAVIAALAIIKKKQK